MSATKAVISRILISDRSQQQFVVLHEVNGPRVLPISIGTFEALAINRFALGQTMERPLTHELLANSIEQLGFKITRIVVTDLRNDIFYAKIYVSKNSTAHEIDARPSDAIAIATKTGAEIYPNSLRIYGQ